MAIDPGFSQRGSKVRRADAFETSQRSTMIGIVAFDGLGQPGCEGSAGCAADFRILERKPPKPGYERLSKMR